MSVFCEIADMISRFVEVLGLKVKLYHSENRKKINFQCITEFFFVIG